MDENEIATIAINLAFKIHSKLGPGLFEAVYKKCLAYELNKSSIQFEVEKDIPLVYEEIKLEAGYRADIIIENKVILEIKSIEALGEIQKKQVLTYIKLADCKLGVLINFNTLHLKDSIKRVVNNL